MILVKTWGFPSQFINQPRGLWPHYKSAAWGITPEQVSNPEPQDSGPCIWPLHLNHYSARGMIWFKQTKPVQTNGSNKRNRDQRDVGIAEIFFIQARRGFLFKPEENLFGLFYSSPKRIHGYSKLRVSI